MAQQMRELMTPNPVTLPGTASVHEAARAMRGGEPALLCRFVPSRACLLSRRTLRLSEAVE